MNIWKMNLKDNREDKPSDLLKSKFEFCKDNGIVGIGWVNVDPENTDDVAYRTAYAQINAFEIGDLVWTKNPDEKAETGRHYLCKITGKAKKADDPEQNHYDVGTCCACEFIEVAQLPEEISEGDLVSRHTIEKANETISDATIKLYEELSKTAPIVPQEQAPGENVKKNKGKKIAIIATLCALLAVGIIFGVVLLLNSSTLVGPPPVLPEGLRFGMTLDEFLATEYFEGQEEAKQSVKENYLYDLWKRNYCVPISGSGETEQVVLDRLNENLPAPAYSLGFYFNIDNRLYQVFCTLDSSKTDELDEDEGFDFDTLCWYYDRALGNMEIVENSMRGVSKTASFENENGDTTCFCMALSSGGGSVGIESKTWAPKIPEITKQVMANALERTNYTVGICTIGLSKLINRYVSNLEIKYYDIPEAERQGVIERNEYRNEVENGAYSQYASNTRIIVLHGDICQNPEIPYLKTTDVDIIKMLFIFDDSGNVLESKKLDECQDLYTCAVLTMYS